MLQLTDIRQKISEFCALNQQGDRDSLIRSFRETDLLISEMETRWHGSCENILLAKNIFYSITPEDCHQFFDSLKLFYKKMRLSSKTNARFLRLWPDFFTFYSHAAQLFRQQGLGQLAHMAEKESEKYTAPLVRKKNTHRLTYDADIQKITPEGTYIWPIQTNKHGLLASAWPSGELVRIKGGTASSINIPGKPKETFCKFMAEEKLFVFSKNGERATIIGSQEEDAHTFQTGISSQGTAKMFFAPFKEDIIRCCNNNEIIWHHRSLQEKCRLSLPQFHCLRGPFSQGGNTYFLNAGTAKENTELILVHSRYRFSCVYDLAEDSGLPSANKAFIIITDNHGIHMLKMKKGAIQDRYYIPLSAILPGDDPWSTYPNTAFVSGNSLKIFLGTYPPGCEQKLWHRIAEIKFVPGFLSDRS